MPHTISLEAVSRKLGDKRRELTSANEALQSKFEAYEKADAALVSLSNSLTAEPTAEQAAELEKLQSSRDVARKEMITARTSAEKLKNEVHEAEEDYTTAQSANSTDQWLTSSAGNHQQRAGGEGSRTLTPGGDAGGLSSAARVLEPTHEQKLHDLGVFWQVKMVAAADKMDPVRVAREHFQNERVASSMAAHDFSRGGSFVQGEFANFYISMLAQKAVLRSCGVPTVPIVNGSMTIPKITDGVIGGYRGEKQRMAVETMKTGSITLVPKEMYVMVPMTLKLIRSASISAASMVREEMFRAGAALEDRHFLRGAPNGAGPTGLRWRAAANNVIAFPKPITPQKVVNFIELLQLRLTEASVDLINPYWITTPGVISYLRVLLNATNNQPLFPEISSGRIGMHPFKMTNYMPNNIATPVLAANGVPAGSGYAELMFMDVGKQLIGDVPGVIFESSGEASYVRPDGVRVDTFQEGEVLFKLTQENDIHTRYEESIAVGVDIDWTVAI